MVAFRRFADAPKTR